MALFGLVPNWRKPIDDAVDVKMTEMLKTGVTAAREKVHVWLG